MNVNSMLHWYPKIKDVVPTPDTVMIEFDCWKYMEDGFMRSPVWADMLARAKEAGRILGYPLFLRTDQMACKHDWEKTCYVPSEDVLPQHIHAVIDGTLETDHMPAAIVLRKFLHLDYKFKAFEGMPVAREFRYFADMNGIHCRHAYWFKDCMEFKHPEIKATSLEQVYALRKQGPPGWEQILEDMAKVPADVAALDALVLKAASWCEEPWSIDVCQDLEGKWWVTDMAKGKDSYHDPACPNAQRPEMAHGLIRHRMGEMNDG